MLFTIISIVYMVDLQSAYRCPAKAVPVRLAYAMTTNKSQGKTLQRVGISLAKDMFLHGQLYVASSRATATKNVSIL